MIRRHSKKIAALVLSLALTVSTVGAPAVFAASDSGSSTTVTAMADSASTALNTFTWSGDTVSAAADDTGFTISAGTVTITEAGTYKLTGSGTGSVLVKAEGVTLILDDLALTSSDANTIESSASDTVIKAEGESTLTNNWNASDVNVAAICSTGQSISITGTGTLNIISTGGEGSGIHADYTLNVGTEGSSDGPVINTDAVNEGIEAITVNLYSGSGTIAAQDDGINADNDADETQTCSLNILGGSWVINSSADGLDSNGNITVSGGTTIVYGSTENDDAAIDFDGELSFTGGLLLGVGMNGMAQTPTNGNYVQFSGVSGITAGTKLEVRDSEGNVIYTAEAVKNADDIVLATYDLTDGDTYTLYVDGTEAAAAQAASTGSAGGPGGDNGQQPPDDNGQQPPDDNGQQPPANSFTDVSESDYFAEAVYWAAASGVTTGTSETTFSPSDTTTRAQIVTFLWRLAGSPEVSSDSTSYTDVDSSAYYYSAVLWAEENGITTGTSETTFSPDEECTRSQIVTFLHRYAKTPDAESSSSFTDVDADAYYANAVDWAAANAITSGTSETTFSPNDSCTRGQAVTFLYNYAKLTGQAGQGMVPPTGGGTEFSGEVPSGNPPEMTEGGETGSSSEGSSSASSEA